MSELQVLLENSQRRNKELQKQLKDIVVDAGKVFRENVDLKAQVETLSVQQEREKKLEAMSNKELKQYMEDLKGDSVIPSLDELENGPWPTFVRYANKKDIDVLIIDNPDEGTPD